MRFFHDLLPSPVTLSGPFFQRFLSTPFFATYCEVSTPLFHRRYYRGSDFLEKMPALHTPLAAGISLFGKVRLLPRRAASFTQADIERAVRAAKKQGAAEVEVRVGDRSSIVIRLLPSTADKVELAQAGEIVL